jgi:hypothetical protein
MPDPIPASNAKYNWLMNGKTIDNVNEALAPTSDITSANVTYLRENYSISFGDHYTEDNVIPIVDAEYGYSLHIITRPNALGVYDHSEVRYVNTVTGIEAPGRIELNAGEFIKSTGCVFESNTATRFRILAVTTEQEQLNGSIISTLRFYKVQDFMSAPVNSKISAFQTVVLSNSLIDGATGSTLHFSTQLVPVDPSKIPALKRTGFSEKSKMNVKKALLVGVSPRQKWNLDMRNTKNNDIELKLLSTEIPVSMNDVVYTDTTDLTADADYKGLKWDATVNAGVGGYKQGLGTNVSKGVFVYNKTAATSTVPAAIESKVTKTTLYDYINNPIKNDEFGHLLCLDVTVNDPASGQTIPDYSAVGDRIWSIRTAPVSSAGITPVDDGCGCDDEPSPHITSDYLLSKDIFNGSLLKTQTHVLITNVMTPGQTAVGFNTESKCADQCRIIPAGTWTQGSSDNTYVAWIREFVLADTNERYSNGDSAVSLFAPTVVPIAGLNGDNSSFTNANGSGGISGVEIIDQKIVTYVRNPVTGALSYSGNKKAESLVFAKLSDVLNNWDATKMKGQGAGILDTADARLNSPFTRNLTLKSNVMVESKTSFSTVINVQITDKFESGLFVFCYVNQDDDLSATELNALNFRGAGVTGMPVIDIDDASVKFGTGRFNHMPMDQVFLENCEKLRAIVSDTNSGTKTNYCFNAANYCGYYTAGIANIGQTGSTLCNVDNLALNQNYNQLTLSNLFAAATPVYKTNMAALSVRAKEFYYNSLCSAKLFQKAIYNPTSEADIAIEQVPLSGARIRIWNAISSWFFDFNLDSDVLDTDLDRKRIPMSSIKNRVAITYPQYHEITSGAHIHYNIANQCLIGTKPTNYVSVFTKGGCVGFYESLDLTKEKAVFMCSIPLLEIQTSGSPSIGSGSLGGNKFGTVADQFFIYALCPNLAGLTLVANTIGASASVTSASIAPNGGTGSTDAVITYDQSYIIAYDLNAISSPPANIPTPTVIPGTNIYNTLTNSYIVAYLADTGKKFLAGTLTAANNLLVVPTGGYSTTSVVRLYRKTDITRDETGNLDASSGHIWAPQYDLLPIFQLTFSARSVTGVTISGNSLFVQGGIGPVTTANFNNSFNSPTHSTLVRIFSLDL